MWARLPCLPIKYFDLGFLQKVREKIGRTIWVDKNIRLVDRGRFACICVEVDMTKLLLAMYKLRGRVRRLNTKEFTLCVLDVTSIPTAMAYIPIKACAGGERIGGSSR